MQIKTAFRYLKCHISLCGVAKISKVAKKPRICEAMVERGTHTHA